ncbi:hypothetical protein CCH79_00004154 [Gambusia affinis]|uniref:Uncharacterized protein n=1 Tax=Gambusia affinis TaxID=33528 RepID=A0A315V4Z3_GAMAF|nr:hypothetical protein CCH79_00004154 [Gambusia affinis]
MEPRGCKDSRIDYTHSGSYNNTEDEAVTLPTCVENWAGDQWAPPARHHAVQRAEADGPSGDWQQKDRGLLMTVSRMDLDSTGTHKKSMNFLRGVINQVFLLALRAVNQFLPVRTGRTELLLIPLVSFRTYVWEPKWPRENFHFLLTPPGSPPDLRVNPSRQTCCQHGRSGIKFHLCSHLLPALAGLQTSSVVFHAEALFKNDEEALNSIMQDLAALGRYSSHKHKNRTLLFKQQQRSSILQISRASN